MMTGLSFHPDVEIEIGEAYHWYEDQADGLGDDYIAELELAFQTIIEMPETWPQFKRGFAATSFRDFHFQLSTNKEITSCTLSQ